MPWLLQAGLLAGPFLTMVDSNIVNVAVPDIARRLETPLSQVQWAVSGYLLALAAALAASSYLARRFGVKRVYLASLLGFTLASALCAASTSITTLVATRVLQGALGAALVPLAMGMLIREGGPKDEFPAAAGMILFLGPAVGPTLGGLLIGAFGWPSIFLINLPVGVLGLLGAWRIPAGGADPADPAARLDVVGLVLLASGLVLVTYGATQGPVLGWLASGCWPFWSAGALLLTAYVGWALRHPDPAVDLRLLRRPQAALAIGLSVLVGVVLFAVLFLVPVFMQALQGRSPLVTGLALLPQGLVMGAGTVMGERLRRRLGTRATVAAGMAILAVSTAGLTLTTISTPPAVIALLLSGRGLALGLTIQPLLLVTLGRLAGPELAHANTLFNVAQRLGGSVGIALLATFLQVRERVRIEAALHQAGIPVQLPAGLGSGALSQAPPFLRPALENAAAAGFHDAVWLLVALSLGGLLMAALITPAPVATSEPVEAAQPA